MKSINNLVLILIKFMFLCNFTILRKLIVEITFNFTLLFTKNF